MVDVADLRCYVLNLARREDRRERIARMLPPDLPVVFTTDWDGPFDGARLDRAAIDAAGIGLYPWQIESDDEDWCRPLKLGEIGCTLHHLAAWRHAFGTGAEPYVVVFEDDAVLAPDFLDRLLAGLDLLAAGPAFDLLYLGRIHYEPAEDTPAMPGFVRPGLSYGAHGYLLRRTALPALLDAGLERAVIPADEFLPCMYMNHPRADLAAFYPPRLRALAFDPTIVGDPPRGDSDTYWTPPIDGVLHDVVGAIEPLTVIAVSEHGDIAVGEPGDIAVGQHGDIAVSQHGDIAVGEPGDIAVSGPGDIAVDEPGDGAVVLGAE